MELVGAKSIALSNDLLCRVLHEFEIVPRYTPGLQPDVIDEDNFPPRQSSLSLFPPNSLWT